MNGCLELETLLMPEDVTVIPFSAEKGDGRDEVLALIFDHVRKDDQE